MDEKCLCWDSIFWLLFSTCFYFEFSIDYYNVGKEGSRLRGGLFIVGGGGGW